MKPNNTPKPRAIPFVRVSTSQQKAKAKPHPYRYSYQAEKLSQARSTLMLPHPVGEDVSIYAAFAFLERAFRQMDESGLDADARGWVRTIKRCMDTTGIEDPAKLGTFMVKAGMLTNRQKFDLSRAVDALAYWFRADMER